MCVASIFAPSTNSTFIVKEMFGLADNNLMRVVACLQAPHFFRRITITLSGYTFVGAIPRAKPPPLSGMSLFGGDSLTAEVAGQLNGCLSSQRMSKALPRTIGHLSSLIGLVGDNLAALNASFCSWFSGYASGTLNRAILLLSVIAYVFLAAFQAGCYASFASMLSSTFNRTSDSVLGWVRLELRFANRTYF